MIFRIELADEFSFSSQIFSYQQNLEAGLFFYVEFYFHFRQILIFCPEFRLSRIFLISSLIFIFGSKSWIFELDF